MCDYIGTKRYKASLGLGLQILLHQFSKGYMRCEPLHHMASTSPAGCGKNRYFFTICQCLSKSIYGNLYYTKLEAGGACHNSLAGKHQDIAFGVLAFFELSFLSSVWKSGHRTGKRP